MEIRTATMDDLEAIVAVETECFPLAEAATEDEFIDRLEHYADHFWLLFDEGELISFVDGMCTDEPDLTDEMYADASMHNEEGAWQMIFGVNTIPSQRQMGFAGQVIEYVIDEAYDQGREGLVLTCKDELVHYYEKFGFVSEGLSESTHGDVEWYQMRLVF